MAKHHPRSDPGTDPFTHVGPPVSQTGPPPESPQMPQDGRQAEVGNWDTGRPQAAPRAKPRGLCPELQAMARIDRILSEMTAPEVSRIVSWLVSRHLNPDEPVSLVEGGG